MGLNFSHNDASWSYSGFNRFRAKLAQEIDINLWTMDGFFQSLTWLHEKGFEKEIKKPNKGPILWNTVDDPIVVFLKHSDCEGILTPRECQDIFPRISQLIRFWPDCYDKTNALLLIKGMELASTKNENLEFC